MHQLVVRNVKEHSECVIMAEIPADHITIRCGEMMESGASSIARSTLSMEEAYVLAGFIMSLPEAPKCREKSQIA